MAFWPEVVDLAALAMVVGTARSSVTSLGAPGIERGHHIDDGAGNRLVVVREEHSEAGTRLCGGTVSHQSSLAPQLSQIASSLP